jgi:hypothetical protein
MQKYRIYQLCLILFSLIGYLEWGGGQKSFIVEVEIDILTKLFTDIKSMLHPLVILPFTGQLILIVTFIRKSSNIKWIHAGALAIGILYLLIFFIGCMLLNFEILISALPFLITYSLFLMQKRFENKIKKTN